MGVFLNLFIIIDDLISMEQVSLDFPKEMKEKAMWIAKQKGLGFAAYVRLAVSELIKKDGEGGAGLRSQA